MSLPWCCWPPVAGRGGAPSGPAGGDLSGTYPNPDVIALHESGGARFPYGPIANGQRLVAAGGQIVGEDEFEFIDDWWPEFPQDPAEAETDYFPGAALNGKWTVWDVAGTQTETVADNWLTLDKNSTAGADWSGIHQPLPAGSLTWTVFCALQMGTGGSSFAGLMIAQDLDADPVNGDFKAILAGTNNTPQLFCQRRNMTGQANVGAAVAATTHVGTRSEFWLRLRYNSAGNTASWDFCGGRRASGWINIESGVGLVFAPAKIGLCVFNQSGIAGRAYFRSFIQSPVADGPLFLRRPGRAIDLARVPP